MLRLLALLIVSALPSMAQDLQCRCTHLQGDEYLCKCTAIGGTTAASPPAALTTRVKDPAPATTEPVQVKDTSGTPTGATTSKGQTVYEGPRGGQYHYSSSGKKVYTPKKK
jgi:hypothetical protein